MKTVLITGPIGSGKSEVRRMLDACGFAVYDCDSRCKALYESVPGLKERIEEVTSLPFGRLSEVFCNPAALKALEDTVYPILIKDIQQWRKGAGETAFIESAIALQKPQFDGMYDSVLLVTASHDVRAGRNPSASSRDAFQNFSGVVADYVIENNSSLDDLRIKVEKYISEL